MATSTYLSNPTVKVGAAIGTIVDITDQVSAATLTVTAEAASEPLPFTSRVPPLTVVAPV